MFEFFTNLLDTSDFPARWDCGSWTAAHGWLHILADLGIWSAYLAIPVVLVYFALRRRNLPFKSMFLLFGAFILACGTTHLMEAVIFWWPAYRLAGVLKLFTALISWATVFTLIHVAPKAFALRSPHELEQEIIARKRLEQGREELEACVRLRTLELWQAKEGYRRNEQRYRSLVEATTAVVWNAPPSGEVQSDLPAWAAFTGQAQEQIRGWGWLDAVHPEDRDDTARAWTAAVATLSFYEVEHRVRRHDGDYRHMLARGVPILDKNAQIIEWVGVHTDVTDQKRAEVALRAAKGAAEAASRAKSEFLANMSHEIRTPLNGIVGMTELALDTELTAQQREYLSMAKLSSQRLLTVINDILDFSKIEAGQLELTTTEFELAQSVGAAIQCLAIGAQQKGLELACQMAANVPEALVGDAGRLCQILINLVGNAIKFTDQGEIVIRVATEERVGDEVCLHFSVQDTGIGIPVDKRQVIFEAFAQADGSTTRKYGGTGLGLTISAQLVSLMHGRLWVDSEPDPGSPNRGSTFHFTARLRVGHGSVARRIRIPPPKLEDMPVLVADDNATNRQILAEVLGRWKMVPTLASGGQAALALLEQAAATGSVFPLVLLDSHMPGVDGFAVAQRIKSDPNLAGTAVLMLTSSGRLGDLDRCQELGIAAHLLKPVAHGELLEAIVRALHLTLERASGVRESTARMAAAKPWRPLRILLAEDDVVNQRLAVGLLEQRGHAVVVAADGHEALAALECELFDLIFMDVQMPEMSGFEATARIRAAEKKTGRHLPIIATTAYAMKGDRERCLASGMDGYVSKPIQPAELYRSIDETLGTWSQGLTAPEHDAVVVTFDHAASLERTNGNQKLLGEMASLFAVECPKRMEEVRIAVVRLNAGALELAAHKLRGSISNFCAPAALAIAGELEAMGRSGLLEGATRASAALESAMQQLMPVLARLTEVRRTS